MNNNIEIEAKVLLTKEQYVKVMKAMHLNIKDQFVQTNYYIDSNQRILKKQNIALRVRELKGNYTLTLKTPMAEGLLEKNQTLSAVEFYDLVHSNKFPEGDVADFLELLDIEIKDLIILAILQTKRYEYPYKSASLALDENSYNGKVDYELELEDSSMALAREKVQEILNGLDIKFEFNHVSKQARAMSTISK